jgi:hypothetical protein
MFINYYKLTEDIAIDGNIITTVLNQPILTTNHIDVIKYLLTLVPEHEVKKISELVDNSITIYKQN